jgi:hypothetical protein
VTVFGDGVIVIAIVIAIVMVRDGDGNNEGDGDVWIAGDEDGDDGGVGSKR